VVCVTKTQVSYAEFQNALHSHARAERVPLSALFELTYRCNFDCVHCYVVEARPKGELETWEVLRILGELREAGTLFLTLSGGEVLTRPDFEEIYLAAKRHGFVLSIYSNAALIKGRALELLASHPPAKLEVTLYGSSEPTYAQVTRRHNMYRLVLENVDRLRARGVTVHLKTVGLTSNRGEYGAIANEAKQRGVEGFFRMDNVVTVRTDCTRGPASQRLDPEEIIAQDRLDPRRVAEYRRLYEQYRGRVPARTKRLFRCGAATTQVVINPRGVLQACALYRKEGFDLRGGSVSQGWQALGEVVQQPITRPTRCRSCDKVALCGACPGNNSLESGGDPEEPPDFLCEIAFARVKAFCDDLRPRVPEPAGRWLPLHRAQQCQRPWLQEVREPVGEFSPGLAPKRRPLGRPLPLSTARG
jgi:radical SAM protein with 4Fe4S-binding SPASM domain